jgi:hypothetical protein
VEEMSKMSDSVRSRSHFEFDVNFGVAHVSRMAKEKTEIIILSTQYVINWAENIMGQK